MSTKHDNACCCLVMYLWMRLEMDCHLTTNQMAIMHLIMHWIGASIDMIVYGEYIICYTYSIFCHYQNILNGQNSSKRDANFIHRRRHCCVSKYVMKCRECGQHIPIISLVIAEVFQCPIYCLKCIPKVCHSIAF